MSVQRKRYSAEEKTRVAIEAIKGQKTLNELAAEYGVHPSQITQWKKQAVEEISTGFSGGRARRERADEALVASLYQEIGQLKMEMDWLKKPWRQKSRRSSGSPALLEREEKGLALVTETKARELLPLCDGGLATKLSPAGAIEPADVLDQLLPPDCILFPPLGVGNRAPITQQIAVPILATADAAVTHLEPADAAFHLIVGAWEPLPVVALHQVRPQVAELLQERGEALLFQLRERAIGQVP